MIMHTRSYKITKKRKGLEIVNLDDIDDLSVADLLQKAILKLFPDKEALDKQFEDIEDQKKIANTAEASDLAASKTTSVAETSKAGDAKELVQGKLRWEMKIEMLRSPDIKADNPKYFGILRWMDNEFHGEALIILSRNINNINMLGGGIMVHGEA
ncbi:hypothetical protein E3N88_18596 [Mikania micrantha]|uniref:Uncharacterized protein n=1 Tax=Mikania micrantha TaxID=192012 RepID=A0A5N6NMK0_9ASTR|nr:hypothetical protein E3N88_18596 [Mikania micrantha]